MMTSSVKTTVALAPTVRTTLGFVLPVSMTATLAMVNILASHATKPMILDNSIMRPKDANQSTATSKTRPLSVLAVFPNALPAKT